MIPVFPDMRDPPEKRLHEGFRQEKPAIYDDDFYA